MRDQGVIPGQESKETRPTKTADNTAKKTSGATGHGDALHRSPAQTAEIVQKGLARRYRSEKRFRLLGISAILLSLTFLSILFISIFSNGYTAFKQTVVQIDVFLNPVELDMDHLEQADYQGMIKASLRSMFPTVQKRRDKKQLYGMISSGAAFQLMDYVQEHPEDIGKTIQLWVPADDDVDMLIKGHIKRDGLEVNRRLNDMQLSWVDRLMEQERIRKRFNADFFTSGDSREPELAGIWGATCGSFYTLMITLLLSFPMGVGAGADSHDASHHHHCRKGCPQISATLHPGSGPWHRCLQNPNGHPPRTAPGHARHAHWYHHRHGPGTGRNSAIADDRHGGIYRGHPRRVHRSLNGTAGTGTGYMHNHPHSVRSYDEEIKGLNLLVITMATASSKLKRLNVR